jgi:hypothetical protein
MDVVAVSGRKGAWMLAPGAMAWSTSFACLHTAGIDGYRDLSVRAAGMPYPIWPTILTAYCKAACKD